MEGIEWRTQVAEGTIEGVDSGLIEHGGGGKGGEDLRLTGVLTRYLVESANEGKSCQKRQL